MQKSSVLLGIDENTEDTALFACSVSNESAAVADQGLRFSEMRRVITTLPAKESAFVSRVLKIISKFKLDLILDRFTTSFASPIYNFDAFVNLSGILPLELA